MKKEEYAEIFRAWNNFILEESYSLEKKLILEQAILNENFLKSLREKGIKKSIAIPLLIVKMFMLNPAKSYAEDNIPSKSEIISIGKQYGYNISGNQVDAALDKIESDPNILKNLKIKTFDSKNNITNNPESGGRTEISGLLSKITGYGSNAKLIKSKIKVTNSSKFIDIYKNRVKECNKSKNKKIKEIGKRLSKVVKLLKLSELEGKKAFNNAFKKNDNLGKLYKKAKSGKFNDKTINKLLSGRDKKRAEAIKSIIFLNAKILLKNQKNINELENKIEDWDPVNKYDDFLNILSLIDELINLEILGVRDISDLSDSQLNNLSN